MDTDPAEFLVMARLQSNPAGQDIRSTPVSIARKGLYLEAAALPKAVGRDVVPREQHVPCTP